jgi:hypothetical protein
MKNKKQDKKTKKLKLSSVPINNLENNLDKKN